MFQKAHIIKPCETDHSYFKNVVDEFHSKITDHNGRTEGKRICENLSVDFSSSEDEMWDTDLEDADCHTNNDDADLTKQRYIKMCSYNDVIPSKFVMDRLQDSSVRLSHGTLRCKEVKALIEALVYNTYIRHLDLQGNKIDYEGVKDLHGLLLENLYITEINLANNMVCNKGAKYIGKILQDSKCLQKLNVSGNCMDDSKAYEIANGIASNESLKVLNLSHNQFMSSAGRDFGLAIEMNRCITELDLSWNHLRLTGAVDFSSGLAWNKSILTLNLSFNGFGDVGAEAMGRALAVNETLRSLNLSYNRISDKGALGLGNGLQKNKGLTHLNIGYNPITKIGSLCLIQAVKQAEDIIELDMEEIYVDKNAIHVIQDIMNARPNLLIRYRGISRTDPTSSFNVELDSIKSEIFSILSKYLKDNSLRMLDLFNRWDKDKSLSLSPDEFVDGFREANIAISQDMLDVLITTLDKNQDGSIGYKEFVMVTKIK